MQRSRLLLVLCTCAAGIAITATALRSQQSVPNISQLREQRAREREAQAERDRMLRNAVRGVRGAVAAGSDPSAEAGFRMLHKGGNAVDAGVAAVFAAAVFESSHVGFGGEAPILIRTKDGKVMSLAGIGTMPKLATAEMFRRRRLLAGEVQQIDPGGLKGIIPVTGLMPALVPGTVEACLVALREYGSLPFADIIQPSLDLAAGFPLDEIRSGSIAVYARFFELWPTSKKHFFPDGQPLLPGEIFAQPDLTRTLQGMIAAEKKVLSGKGSRTAAIDAVRDYFYRGEIARKIDTFVKANDGLLRYEDMAAFRITPEQATCVEYRGYGVCKPGFWSQGPVMLQALNILQGIPLASLGHNSPDYVHKIVEALKLAYADRDAYYGDPRMNKIPADRLLSAEYASERRDLIGARASLDFRPGNAGGRGPLHPATMELARVKIDDALMARDTTGINVVDKDGMMFSATPSGAWLPPVIAGDTGIPLTQRAQSFLLIPGHPNELAGGKRPRVTLSPAIITHNGKPFLTIATPGGDNQDQALIQILLNVVEFGMEAQRAVEAPRFQTRHLVSSFDNHAMNPGDLLIDERFPPAVYNELMNRGHRTARRSRWNSGANPVAIRVLPNGVIEAGADPYGNRVALAW